MDKKVFRKIVDSGSGDGPRTGLDLPFVSVVMPVRNEAAFIETSLKSVIRQDHPHDLLEIVVADGVSTDTTVDLINKLADQTDIGLKVVQNPKKIAPAALNLAIAEAQGEIIVRIDGHCEIEPDYVSNCVRLLRSGKADGVGGPIETVGEGVVAESISLAMSSGFGVGGSAFRTVNDREMYVDTVAFPGYTREIIERAGPFNEELVRNQDDEYNFRIRKLGGRILLSPTIRSKYYSRSSFRSLWRQYFQYGYWKVRVLQLHPRQMSIRQFVPFIFVVSLILLSIVSMFSSTGRWLLFLLIISYLLANIAAAINTARRRLILVPFVSVSFFILHCSYGLGSLTGLFAFRNQWNEPSELTADRAFESVP